MMRWPDKILNVSARTIRMLPHFRGRGRVVRWVNGSTLKIGAAPIVQAVMKNGTAMRLDLRSETELYAFYTGEYDEHLLSTISALYDCNSLFLDIGANIGFYSVAIANLIRRRQARGGVIAFEPYPVNCRRLMENIAINKLDDLCSVFSFGLSNREGSELLVLGRDFKEGSLTGNAAIASTEMFDTSYERVTIEVKPLDALQIGKDEKHGLIDFVKMDIEGHEDFCLEGGRETFKRHRPTVLMEINKPYFIARGLDLNQRLMALLPEEYMIYRFSGGYPRVLKSFEECPAFDNVVLVPVEKEEKDSYMKHGFTRECAKGADRPFWR